MCEKIPGHSIVSDYESIESHLLTIQTMVNDALRFAEGKNAALITFNGAALYVSSMSKTLVPPALMGVLPYLQALLVLSIGVCLLAFLPLLNPPKEPSAKEVKMREALGNSANIFFFGHLRLFEPEQLVRYVHRIYGQPVPTALALNECFLSSQLILQSRIAVRKHALFTVAGQLTVFALVLPVPVLAGYWGFRLIAARRAAREEKRRLAADQ